MTQDRTEEMTESPVLKDGENDGQKTGAQKGSGRLFHKCATCGELFDKSEPGHALAFTGHLMRKSHKSAGTVDENEVVIAPPTISGVQKKKLREKEEQMQPKAERSQTRTEQSQTSIGSGEAVLGHVPDNPPGPPGGVVIDEASDGTIIGFGIPVRVFVDTWTLSRYQVMRAKVPHLTLGSFFDICSQDCFRARGVDVGITKIGG